MMIKTISKIAAGALDVDHFLRQGEKHMKTLLTAVPLLLALLAMPAYSFQCPLDIQKIEAALDAGPGLTPDQLAQVEALLAEGRAHHKAGAHGDAVAVLAKAKRMLNIE